MSRRARTVPVVLGACIAFITLVVLTGSEVKHQLGGRHASRRSAIESSCADAGETAGSGGRADWLGRGGTSACRADGREGSGTDTNSRGKPRAGREASGSRTQTKGVKQREPKAHKGRVRESV